LYWGYFAASSPPEALPALLVVVDQDRDLGSPVGIDRREPRDARRGD
jgi:hypothetical protein